MKHPFLKKALAFLLLLCLLCPTALAETADVEETEENEPLQLREIHAELGQLTPIQKTHYLLSQNPKEPATWGLMSTSGEELIPYTYTTLSYIAYDCFQAGVYEPIKNTQNRKLSLDYINSQALVAADGTLITEHRYGTIKVFNHYWAAGWVLEEATEEDYDLKYDSTHYYKIEHVDIYWLGDYCIPGSAKREKPYWRGALTRDQYKNAQAHDRYLSVQDREDQVTMYNSAFQVVDHPNALGTAAYRLRNYAVLNPEGDVIMDGYTAASEVNTTRGILLNTSRVDYSGVTWNGLYTLEGEVLLEPTDYGISGVTASYAILSKDKLQGLYSLTEQRFIVPCEFDKIIANSQGFDDYVMNGYVIVEKDGVRSYYDIAAGAVAQVIDTTLEKYAAMACAYNYLNEKSRTVLVAADGYTQVIADNFTAVRGDGYLLPYKKGKYYGLMNWHGAEVLSPMYKNPIVITDDGHVIIHSPQRGFCLYELVAETPAPQEP